MESDMLFEDKIRTAVVEDGTDLEDSMPTTSRPSAQCFSLCSCMSRLSPLFILWFLVLCQLVNYFDRGAVSGLVKPVGEYFDLSKFERGLIGGAFMLGYMIFAPMAGFLTQYIRGARIMAFGLTLWIIAAVVASFSWHLYPLLATRILLGFGEATFASIAPAIIDDISIPRTRSLWLSIYFMAMPVGSALGFVAAGSISTAWSWRVVFIVEACLMVPFPIICFFLPHISVIVENGIRKLSHADRAAKTEETLQTNALAETAKKFSFWTSLHILVTNPVYVLAVLGYSCFTYSLGGITFWAGEYFTELLNMPLSQVTLLFGIVSALAGLLGAIAGGLLMDKLGGTAGLWGIPRAMAVCAVVTIPATAFGAGCVIAGSPAAAFPLSFFGVFFITMAFAPVNGVILRVVPSALRAFAVSLNLFVIHLIGDFPSPIVTGWIADGLVSPSCDAFCGLQASMLMMMCYLGMASVFWGCGLLVATLIVQKSVDIPSPVTATEEFSKNDLS